MILKNTKSLTLLFTLFFGNFIFSEQVPLVCEITKEFRTFFYDYDGDDVLDVWTADKGGKGREEQALGSQSIKDMYKKYLLIDKNLASIGYGDKKEWREDPFRSNEITYEWGPIWVQTTKDNLSLPFDTRISINKFLNPLVGDWGMGLQFSINRESLELKHNQETLSREPGLGNKFGTLREYFYSCKMITLNELEAVKKEAIEYQLKKKRERKLKQKI